MTQEMKVALDIIKAYEASRKHGILVLRDYSFVCEELEFMAEIVFKCLNNNINSPQIYEILNNYREDFENEKVHKIIVDGFMCIIGGDNIEHLKELLASILGRKNRKEFLEEAERLVGSEPITDSIIKKYSEKEPFSENTELPKDILQNAEKVRMALKQMNNIEVSYILAGISGEKAEKIINMMEPDMIKLIDEDTNSIRHLQEEDIIDAEKKFMDILNTVMN